MLGRLKKVNKDDFKVFILCHKCVVVYTILEISSCEYQTFQHC